MELVGSPTLVSIPYDFTDTDAQVPLEIALDIIIPRLKIRSVQGGTDRSLDVEQGRIPTCPSRHWVDLAAGAHARVVWRRLSQPEDITHFFPVRDYGASSGSGLAADYPRTILRGVFGTCVYGSADPPALRSVLLSRSRKVTLHTFNAIYQLQRSGVKW